jgi:hypothetical protein
MKVISPLSVDSPMIRPIEEGWRWVETNWLSSIEDRFSGLRIVAREWRRARLFVVTARR